jgi:hypothetical protein
MPKESLFDNVIKPAISEGPKSDPTRRTKTTVDIGSAFGRAKIDVVWAETADDGASQDVPESPEGSRARELGRLRVDGAP